MASSANIEQLVLDLNNPATRETALLELSKKREQFPGEYGPTSVLRSQSACFFL